MIITDVRCHVKNKMRKETRQRNSREQMENTGEMVFFTRCTIRAGKGGPRMQKVGRPITHYLPKLEPFIQEAVTISKRHDLYSLWQR